MTDQDQNRQPAGTPTGGQFTATERAEAGVSLDAEKATEPTWLPPTVEEIRAGFAAANRRIANAIPEPLREDHDRLGAAITDLDQQIAALHERRSALWKELDAVYAMASEEANTDADLVALRNRGAYEKFEAEVRGLHPRFFSTIEWTPTWPTDEDPLPTLGVHVSLTDYGRRHLEDEDPQVLADALVSFARRFITDVPRYGDYAGKVCADIMTEGESNLTIWHSLDGTDAVLVNRNRRGDEIAEGALADVVAAAIKVAIRDRDQPRHDDDCWH